MPAPVARLGVPTARSGHALAEWNAAGKAQPRSDADGAEVDTTTSVSATINHKITQAPDTDAVLDLVTAGNASAVNVATALHRLAAINKHRRAGRDALLRDPRFELLMGATVDLAPDFSARSVADVLWSCATLGNWPATLLKPVLTSVAMQLQRDAFEVQHLSTMVWALARLECKPVRLLEQMEAQALPRLAVANTQNCANLLWGFSRLNYAPAQLLPALEREMLEREMLVDAKPVEVADLASALARVGTAGSHEGLLLALASRAAPEAILESFSSRQIVTLIDAFVKLDATACLPAGLIDAWVAHVRAAHQGTPLLAGDAASLEASLTKLGMESGWIKETEMLSAWSDLASSKPSRSQRAFTEDELRVVFASIDTDSSGDIDRAELGAAIRAIDPTASDETVETMLSFGDQDGDLEVSFDEFKHIMNTMVGKAEPRGEDAAGEREAAMA